MFKSDGSRRDFPLTRDRIIIGRTNEVGLRIPLSSVSRKHCEIAIEGDVVRLRDLGSSNGTLHNNVRVKEAVLSPGDRVEVGPVVFIVVIDGVPAEVEKVCSLVEQDLVDTSVGIPAVSDDQPVAGEAAGKVMEPGSAVALPANPAAAVNVPVEAESGAEAEAEVLGELEEQQAPASAPARSDAPKSTPVMPVAPAAEANEEDALAAAARAAEMAGSKPRGPGESFSDGATEIDLEDPIAALERLAAAERAQEDKFSLFTEDGVKASKPKKK